MYKATNTNRIISTSQNSVYFTLDFDCSSYDILVGITESYFGKTYYIAILNWHISTIIGTPRQTLHNYEKICKAAKFASLNISEQACEAIALAVQFICESVNL
jgi:hypothetical protein